MKIYKITNSLTEKEIQLGIIQIKPIMGSELASNEYFKYMIEYYRIYYKILTPSVVGCALSHCFALNKIIESKMPGIILEDDIDICSDQLIYIKNIIEYRNLDFIHLGFHPKYIEGKYFYGKKIHKDLFKINTSIDFDGAFSYYISPKFAKYILEKQKKILIEADAWGIFFSGSKFQAYFTPIFFHPFKRGLLQSERVHIPKRSLSKFLKLKLCILFDLIYNKLISIITGDVQIKP